MLEELKTEHKVVGIKQSLRAIESGTVSVVFLAGDADSKIQEQFKSLINSNSLGEVHVESMKQLGKACGIDVGAAVACLLK